jgi:hypothetical protein
MTVPPESPPSSVSLTAAARQAEPAAENGAARGVELAAATAERWSAPRKVLFRLALAYFAIHLFPYPLSRFATFWPITGWLHSLTRPIVHAAGVRLLAWPDERRLVGGCGDRADHYLAIAFELGVALAAAALWSWVDRRRPNYRRLAYWGGVALRYHVGQTMLEYGIIKLLKSQFPFPSPTMLLTPLGEFQPMRVLWILMGISAPYTFFIGACELLGASLLFFRKTLSVGALLTLAVLLNVFLMNLFYGVCVKLVSAHLLLMTAALLVPDGRRLFDAVVLGRAVPVRIVARPDMSPRLARALTAAKLVVVPGLLALAIQYGYGAWHRYGDAAPKPPLFGIWDVESFSRNGQVVAPDGADGSRWRSLAVDSAQYASLRRVSGKPTNVGFVVDPAAHGVQLGFEPDGKTQVSLSYTEPGPALLELRGELDGAQTVIRLKQRAMEQIPLSAYRWRWTSDL